MKAAMTRSQMERVRARVREHHSEWQEFHHAGPCYSVAVALRRAGYGKVARCSTFNQDTKRWYGHYVCQTASGKILDMTGEYLKEKRRTRVRYKNVYVVDYDRHDGYPETTIEFWQERLGDLL
jgi:hypothetical protein